ADDRLGGRFGGQGGPTRTKLREASQEGVPHQRRISQTSTKPSSALARPIARSTASGVSSTAVTACLAFSGNAAKIKPSMTNTRPRATRKSDMKPDRKPGPERRGARRATQRAALGGGGVTRGGADDALAPSRGLPFGSRK